MKKSLLSIALAALFLIASNQPYTRLVRLTVINKAGMPIELKLTGITDENHYYYLRIPYGERECPLEMVFTIIPDTYNITTYYVETWDPVYGYDCSATTSKIDANGNVRVTVLECDRVLLHPGEHPLYKVGTIRWR